MKIIITGTHFTAAQAVIEQLQSDTSIKITYLGRGSTQEGDQTPSIESQVLPKMGVKFIPLISGRLQRSFTLYTIPSLFKIPLGFLQSFYFIFKEKPDVVLSFGGYVAVPVVISAWLLSIPVIIHEQTLIFGLANMISAYFANKVAVSFEQQHSFVKDKIILTGNPLRKEILAAPKMSRASDDVEKILNYSKNIKLPLILITGGNQGSHVINETVASILPKLTDLACVIHQTGDSKFADFDKLTALRKGLNDQKRYLVKKWVEVNDFGVILENVDLVITRAGINILLELAYFKKPALVVPIPYLHQDEQIKNADFFAELGLVHVLPQKYLTPQNLLAKTKGLIKDLQNLTEKAKGANNMVIEDAAKRLALETLLLGRRRKF